MQLNILHLNGLVNFFIFLELSTFLHELNHPFWASIETTIQMLYIAFINIYENTHNNLMFHIYIWMG
jgi:hypothetical protein